MTTKKKSPTPKKKTAKKTKKTPRFFYVIRACESGGYSFHNFKWPTLGPVQAPRFIRNGKCGDGLHGWTSLKDIGISAPGWFNSLDADEYRWLVVKVPYRHKGRPNYEKLNSKVKFGYGKVLSCDSLLYSVRYFASLTKGHKQP